MVQFPVWLCGPSMVKWSYLLHDCISLPLQLWSVMDYSIDYFQILKPKKFGPSMDNLFQKLLLEVDGDFFQTTVLCHALTHCSERCESSRANSMTTMVQSLQSNQFVTLDGENATLVYSDWCSLHMPIVTRLAVTSLVSMWKTTTPYHYNCFM